MEMILETRIFDQGAQRHALCALVDISDRKRMEDELTRAKDAAQSADRAKGEFLAMMSHEIRTPMSGIMGMTELALASDLDERQMKYIKAAHASAMSLMSVINDILDFSKIEAGKLTLDRAPFRLREVLESIVTSFDTQFTEAGLKLSLKVAEESPDNLVGDPNRLRQVLVNLIGNGLKFTQKGGVEVAVRPSPAPAAQGEVRLTFEVRDTGIGIDPDHLEHIFDGFTQVDSSMSRSYQGTGLGLTICRHLTRLMGGDIFVESERGKGSAFLFEALFHEGVLLEGEEVAMATGGLLPKGMRVLLAEDNRVNQLFLSTVLRGYGVEVVSVEDGGAVLPALEREHFDLILMDISMPEMSGIEATRLVRKKGSDKNIPIIALTAHTMKGDKENFLAAGMNGYVSKPIEVSELIRVMREAATPEASAVECDWTS